MRTKDFIYYASAAVLLAVTTQVAQADEVATQTPSITEGNQYQPATAAEIFGGEAALPVTPSSTVSAPEASSEVAKASAPVVSTSPASQSSEAATATASTSVANSTTIVTSTSAVTSNASSESVTASAHSTASEAPNSTVATPAKLTNSTDVPSPTLKVQPKTFIDVSSHNGEISVDDYRALARQGVGGVVVKLTHKFVMLKLPVFKYLPIIFLDTQQRKKHVQRLVSTFKLHKTLTFQRVLLWLMISKTLRCFQISTVTLKHGLTKCISMATTT